MTCNPGSQMSGHRWPRHHRARRRPSARTLCRSRPTRRDTATGGGTGSPACCGTFDRRSLWPAHWPPSERRSAAFAFVDTWLVAIVVGMAFGAGDGTVSVIRTPSSPSLAEPTVRSGVVSVSAHHEELRETGGAARDGCPRCRDADRAGLPRDGRCGLRRLARLQPAAVARSTAADPRHLTAVEG